MSTVIKELEPYQGKFFTGEWPTITEMFNITLSRFPERPCFTVFEKTKKIGILAKLKEMFMLKKKRNIKKEEASVEVVENNMEADAKVVEKTKTAPATPQEVITKNQQKVQQTVTHDAASDYLRKMRGM